jgi:LysE type translocator
MSASIAVFTQGLVTCAALIIAIGAQNAFVLRQGILREHVFVVALLCALSDAFLVSIGVAGLGRLVQQSPILLDIARYGGAAFLFAYVSRSGERGCCSSKSAQNRACVSRVHLSQSALLFGHRSADGGDFGSVRRQRTVGVRGGRGKCQFHLVFFARLRRALPRPAV